MDLQKLDLTTLMDMLSEQTTIYTRLLADRNDNDEFSETKELIKHLQAEIEYRKTIVDPIASPDPRGVAEEEKVR